MDIYVITYCDTHYDETTHEVVGAFTNRKAALLALLESSYGRHLEVVKDGAPQSFDREIITLDDALKELAELLEVTQ